MHKNRKSFFIAIIFLQIFFLPIQYRFIHILQYHLPGFEKAHHSIASDEHHNCNHNNEKKGNVFFEEYEKECPIVSYEFAISDEPKPAVTYQTFTYQTEIIQEVTNTSFHSFTGSIKQLRAPPTTTFTI